MPETEVVPQTKRRQFSSAYKLRILAEADACTQPGKIGSLLRREGLYSSYLVNWRRQLQRGQLSTKKRGPKKDPQAGEITRLRGENERLRNRLEAAEAVADKLHPIDIQKKLSQLLGLRLTGSEETTSSKPPNS